MLTLSVAVLQRCKPSESIYSISNLSQSGCAHLSRQTHQRNRFQPALLSAIYYESVRQNSDGYCYVHKMRKGKLTLSSDFEPRLIHVAALKQTYNILKDQTRGNKLPFIVS